MLCPHPILTERARPPAVRSTTRLHPAGTVLEIRARRVRHRARRVQVAGLGDTRVDVPDVRVPAAALLEEALRVLAVRIVHVGRPCNAERLGA